MKRLDNFNMLHILLHAAEKCLEIKVVVKGDKTLFMYPCVKTPHTKTN